MKLWNVSSVTELILMLSGNRGEQHQSLSPWVLKLSSHRHNLCLSIQFVFRSTRLSQILFTTCRRSHAKDQSGNCSITKKETFSMVEFVVCWLCRYASVSQRPAFKPGFRQYQRHALVQQRCSLHGTDPDRWWLGLAWSSSVSRAFDLKLLEQFANTVHWCCLNDERLTSPRLAYHLWIVDWFHLGSEYGKLYANFETRSPWKLSTTNCWVMIQRARFGQPICVYQGDESDEERSAKPVRSVEQRRLRFESDLRQTSLMCWDVTLLVDKTGHP